MGNWFSWLDLKHAFRLLRKRPLLELTAPLSLATGIAVAVIGVTVLDAVAFSTLPYETRTVTASCGSGARSSDISTLVSRQALRQLALGSLLGMALGYGVRRLAQSLEHGLSTTRPWELAAAAVALAVAGLLACWVPVRRALRVDPARALSDD